MPSALGVIASANYQAAGGGGGGTPPVTGYLAWYDPSDVASITASAGAVSQLADKSGNGLHLVQATGAAQPTTGTRTINGRNVLDFDGTNDLLAVSTSAASSPYTVFFVFENDTLPSGDYRSVVAYGSGSNAFFGLRNSQVVQKHGGVESYGGPTLTTGAPLLASFTVGSASSAQWVNAATAGTGTQTADARTAFTMGSRGGGGGYFIDGKVAEVIVYPTVLSTTDRQLVEAYLAAKWGTPWSPGLLSGLAGWYDADDLATITASGGNVSQWADKSGNGRHLVQGTGSFQPVTGTLAVNGRNTVNFDSNIKLMTAAMTVGQPVTVYAVLSPTSYGGSSTPRWIDCGGTGNRVIVYTSSGVWTINGGTATTTGLARALGPQEQVAVFNGAASAFYMNGTQYGGALNAGTGGIPASFRLGDDGGGGNNGIPAGYGEVVVQAGTPSGADLANWQTYVVGKWGPQMLPGLAAWYDASDASTITASAGKVSQWSDKSGVGNHVIQPTSARQPSTGTRTLGGRNVLDFLFGNINCLYTTTFAFPAVNTLTFYIVLTADYANNDRIAALAKPGQHDYLPADTAALLSVTPTKFYTYSGIERASVSPTVAAAAVVTVQRNADVWSIWKNGTAGTGSTANPTTAFDVPRFCLAALADAGGDHVPSFTGAIAEVIVCSTAHGTTDRTATESYLKAKWGTP